MDLEGVELLGGEGRIVVVDEASASRRKYIKGRAIPTNSICILGGVAIEEAGRRFLSKTPDRILEGFV